MPVAPEPYVAPTPAPKPRLQPFVDPKAETKPSTLYYPEGVADAERVLREALSAPALDAQRTSLYGNPGFSRHPGYLAQPAKRTEEAQQAVTDARTGVDNAYRYQRVQAIGGPSGSPEIPKHLKSQTKALTREEYSALSDEQRAAVDFNTQLIDAVRQDRRLQGKYTLTPEAQAVLDKTVEKMFGADGGSTQTGKATAELLQSIGFQDQAADLDDFLQLKAAIDMNQLKQLAPGFGNPHNLRKGVDVADPVENTLGQDRMGLARALAQASLFKRRDATPEYFDQALSALANDQLDPNAVLTSIRSEMPDDEMVDLVEYLKAKVKAKTPLGTDATLKYRKPEAVLEILRAALERDKVGGGSYAS
jgi:hypothetical protein